MSNAGHIELENGTLRLAGVLDFHSGPQLRIQGGKLIRQARPDVLRIDCADVIKSTSVGLSLVLAFMRDAASLGCKSEVVNLPEDMQHIAEVSSMQDVLQG